MKKIEVKDEDEKDEKQKINEKLRFSSIHNNASNQVKQLIDENENCFQLNFLNSFNANIKNEEFLINEEEEKGDIFLQKINFFEKPVRKYSLEADHCMMFTDEN